mmetsp:Transcript_5292/g.16311  ORF Transcript_5292/g.16311 Transcript_5292/m.16311 type:complete len:230 (-) Transcript_5292:16-705(-)
MRHKNPDWPLHGRGGRAAAETDRRDESGGPFRALLSLPGRGSHALPRTRQLARTPSGRRAQVGADVPPAVVPTGRGGERAREERAVAPRGVGARRRLPPRLGLLLLRGRHGCDRLFPGQARREEAAVQSEQHRAGEEQIPTIAHHQPHREQRGPPDHVEAGAVPDHKRQKQKDEQLFRTRRPKGAEARRADVVRRTDVRAHHLVGMALEDRLLVTRGVFADARRHGRAC